MKKVSAIKARHNCDSSFVIEGRVLIPRSQLKLEEREDVMSGRMRSVGKIEKRGGTKGGGGGWERGGRSGGVREEK